MQQVTYRVIGAYDSETTNINIHGQVKAFPILHQLGLLDCPISEITPDNVETHVSIELYRHTLDLHMRLDELCDMHNDYVPVLLCHNLSFDMYSLASWLNEHDVRVLAKSPRKPITFTVLGDNGKPVLVIWDTLIFSQQSLSRMGMDCGYEKADGEWNYDLIRTPKTPLSPDEITYAKRDIYALITWLSWWLKNNSDISESKLGLNVVTKTGVVRERRHVRFERMRNKRYSCDVGKYWLHRCRNEAPKTDDELFTMLACTRGGLTFCASRHASIPYDFRGTGNSIIGYDATSQHPAQIVSRYYPIGFKQASCKVLQLAFEVIQQVTLERVLAMHDKPFPVAFNACFKFTNIRPKKGTLFEHEGIFPLASARYKKISDVQIEENGDLPAHVDCMKVNGYVDSGTDVKTAFGKIVSADSLTVYITELTAWEICQCYIWDDVQAISGYETGRFTKPSDIDVISIMQFYKSKNLFKIARDEYFKTGTISNYDELFNLRISPSVLSEMKNGTANNSDVDAVYTGLKADLNSIFGISATNSYRRDTILDENGIGYEGEFGICNAPKTNKVWYQFGQRIVGWSRIAQMCVMMLAYPYVHGIINGDTDSIKMIVSNENKRKVEKALARYAHALDHGKKGTCARVRNAYPKVYDSLDGIGYYVEEFTTKRFCASWNKAYLMQYDNNEFDMTIAGIPTKTHVEAFAKHLYDDGMSYEQICNTLLGYNVTYANDLLDLNGRKHPKWGEIFFEHVTDYLGNTSVVSEPVALALFPMSKTINDMTNNDNRVNAGYAVANNPEVNVNPILLYLDGILDMSNLGSIFNG